MDIATLGGAVLLGIVEGLTEFIPVSSTGHLILLVDLIGFRGPPGKVFEVAIQLGAILAVCWLYRAKLFGVALGMFAGGDDLRFARNVLLAFLPAMAIGFFAHGFIKSVLFSPWVVAVMLVAGGVAILLIERGVKLPHHHVIERFPLDARAGHRLLPGLGHDSRRLALRRHHHGCAAAARRPPRGDRILFFPSDSHDARRHRLRSVEEPRRANR